MRLQVQTDLQRKTLTAVSLILLALIAFTGCMPVRNKPVIIWTDRPEMASYVELFNSQQQGAQAVVVYKSPLVSSIPPAKDEENPDIVIGSWLMDSRLKKNFLPLESLFSLEDINPATIYPTLLAYGKKGIHQYLLPVSFNLPLLIFSSKNMDKLPDAYMLNTDEIRDTAAQFNTKNSHDIYTSMGFAPSWNTDFLYITAKMNGLTFREKGTSFQWDDDILKQTVSYLRSWTEEKNTSTTAEQDFAFKYLYTPDYRQVESNRCLFAYTSSEDLFKVPYEQLGNVDFRWIEKDDMLTVKDDIVMMGIYKGSYNTRSAENFVIWLMQESTQRAILERTHTMQLNINTFGINGGFSAIQSVNERIFPTYYRNLLGNLPAKAAIQPPPTFPARWNSFKERVVIPYLQDATNTARKPEDILSLNDRITAWLMQFN